MVRTHPGGHGEPSGEDVVAEAILDQLEGALQAPGGQAAPEQIGK
jgi:hypothetical protein